MALRTLLPAPLNALVGREQELTTVEALLARLDVRLLTVTGPGGVGKTRLALEVAARVSQRFSDDVVFVSLAEVQDSSLLLPTIARAFDLQEQNSQPTGQALVDVLQTKHLLIILDNFEHLLASAGSLVELLTRCPHLTLLVISRAVLRVTGEHVFSLRPLPIPGVSNTLGPQVIAQNAAVRLFVARAQAMQIDFTLTPDNSQAVATICERLDGLPLAIELAASQISLFTPHTLLAHLEQRLSLLKGGARDLPARLQTMRNAVAWSYHLLTAEQQILFRRLAVYVGGCTVTTAEAASASSSVSPMDVVAGMAALVDHSLLQRMERAGIPESEPRFMMLEVIREFALEQLEESGEASAVRRAHALYFMALAEAGAEALRTADQQEWRERLEDELGNFRAALALTLGDSATAAFEDADGIGLRLAGALWYFWFQRGLLTEGRRWITQALKVSLAGGVAGAQALLGAGALAWRQSDYGAAHRHLEDSLALWRSEQGQVGLAEALHLLGHVTFDQRDYGKARLLFEESRVRYVEAGDVLGSIPLVGDLGMVAYHLHNNALAQKWFEDSLRLSSQYELKDRTAEALNRLGDLARLAGNNKKAERLYEDSLKHWQALRGKPGTASALHKLGQISRRHGDLHIAHAHYTESLILQLDLRNRQGIAECLAGLAGVAYDLGEFDRAARLLGASAQILTEIGAPLAPADQAAFDIDLSSTRTCLGPDAWEEAWSAGWQTPLEETIKTELSVTPPVTHQLSAHDQIPQTLLSRREREVAALVARGLTNRAIAETLVIGDRTVETHVSRILAKFGFSSRSQIASWFSRPKAPSN